MSRFLLAMTLVLSATTASASPVTIEILSAAYRTVLTNKTQPTSADPVTVTSRTNDSEDPLHERLQVNPAGYPWLYADATANLFSVLADTAASPTGASPASPKYLYADAQAMTTLVFSVMTNTSGLITLDALGHGVTMYSDGRASLRDLTTGTAVWSYGWNCCQLSGFRFGIDDPKNQNHGIVNVGTSFDASHVYQLDLMVKTYAHFDAQDMRIQVSGLEASGVEATPEPSSLLLMSTAIAGFAVRRRRRAARSVN